MINFSIEKPTTLIKITKLEFETKCINDSIFTKNIDFYNDNFDESRIFNNLEENMDEQQLYQEQPFKRKKSNIYVNGLIYKKNSRTMSAEKDFNILKSTLKFDIRVKYFKLFDNDVLVYFFCELDALSFYMQYFNFFKLSFQQFCNWSPIQTDTFSEIKPKILYSKNNKNTTTCKEDTETIVYGRNRFFEAVEYFNNLKSNYNKNDLQQFSDDVSNNITDFAFCNTKELAVGSKSNKIMQEAFKIMSGEELDNIYDLLGYDIAAISASKHGAYTIQTLLTYSTNISHKQKIVKYFAKEGEFLLAHEIGNYTFQKLASYSQKLVCKFFINNFQDVVQLELGFKVFKRCIQYLSPIKEDLINCLTLYSSLSTGIIGQLKALILNL